MFGDQLIATGYCQPFAKTKMAKDITRLNCWQKRLRKSYRFLFIEKLQ
jgi:hypothetical protein